MNKLFKSFLTLCLLIAGTTMSWAEFKDFSVIVSNASGSLLTADEQVQGTTFEFGVAVDAEGKTVRVAKDDASSIATVSGKYHSDHGSNNLKIVTAVEGGVKVTFGNCTYNGGKYSLVAADGTKVEAEPSEKSCWKNGQTSVTEVYYTGGATTLTINGNSYTPYIKVEKSSYTPASFDVTYSALPEGVTGVMPANVTWTEGNKFSLPLNRTLYKEGSTLTGWTDGTNTYKPGEAYTPTANVAFTPVFEANKVSLADPRDTEVTVCWDFQRKNGAPTIGWEGGSTIRPWIAQATIGSEVIDVKMDCDVSAGKIANGNWSDWAQMNGGTKLTIPAAKTVTLVMESYSATTTTTVDGSKDYVTSGTKATYEYAGDAATIDIVIGDGSYWRTFTATYPKVEKTAAGTVYENKNVVATWPLGKGVDDETTATLAEEDQAAFTMTEYAHNFSSSTVETTNGFTFTKYLNGNANVYFKLKPSKGITFAPSNIAFNMIRFGTDGGTISVGYQINDGDVTTLKSGLKPRRGGKEADAIDASIDMSGITVSDDQIITFVFTIADLGSNKQCGLANVKISGVANGTVAQVTKYALTTAVAPEAAGTITIKPKATQYDEGTEVTLTANKNFGYNFANWTDAEGNVLGSENVLKVTMDAVKNITANFEKIATYQLNYAVDGGANLYMVTPSPAPTVVDGKNMYETGTNVMLTASQNEILTFTNWSDGQTTPEITVKMDKDVNMTANYSAKDFIVGWDFVLSGNNGRKADFAAAENDAVSLVMYKEDGSSAGWLDKSAASGGYEGRPGGVCWVQGSANGDVGHCYWQTKVNAEAFTNIIVKTAMVYNYNAYQTYNVEYSLNGTEWTKLGAINMTGVKSWTDAEFALPAAADNQKEVYLRWIADKTSNVDGTASKNDGACIGATWILGTAKLVDDPVAPALVSSVPTEGANNASANGKVVLTFDKKVQLAEGAMATIGAQQISGSVAGKVATFEYKGLEYSTNYTFTLPANTIANLTGTKLAKAITVNFSTRAKPEVQKALYDVVVENGEQFRAAIEKANSRADKSKRFRIFVKAGNHIVPTKGTMAGTNESESKTFPDPRLDLTASNVSIIGEGLEATTIKNTCPDAKSGTTNPIEGLRHAYTLHNSGSYTYIQDLKLINGMEDATGRGEAYEESGDKTILKNVGLWGYQDTYCSNNGRGRYYFEGGVIRGRTDYICGKDDIFFNGVEFRNVGSGYIAVPSSPKQYGYIMRDCRITAEDKSETDGKYTLGRPWGSGTPIALWINTTMEVIPSAIGWNEMSGGWPKRFAEYNSVTKAGSVIDLSGRKKTFGDHTNCNNPVLTAEEAAFYTISNVLGGTDEWDPTAATEQASAPQNVALDGTALTWDNSNYVLCWAVCKDGKVVEFTTEPAYTVDDASAKWSVRAANEMGGLGEATEASTGATAIGTVSPAATRTVKAIYNISGQIVSDSYVGTKIVVYSDGTSQKIMK